MREEKLGKGLAGVVFGRGHAPFGSPLGGIRQVEARRDRIRGEARQLDIDLYPPGAEPDSVEKYQSASG